MDDFPRAIAVIRAEKWGAQLGARPPAIAEVWLDYDARFVRRKRLTTACGRGVLVDLAQTVSLNAGDVLHLADGGLIVVHAAPEAVLQVRGDLPRLAWHIGNRHTPCQIEGARLLIRQDHVIEQMLRLLGADLTATEAPFCPEGGAYGHGRTLGHDGGGQDHEDHEDHDLHGAPDHQALHAPAQTQAPEFFGLHHHGDGKLHFHAPKPPNPPNGGQPNGVHPPAPLPFGHKDAGQ